MHKRILIIKLWALGDIIIASPILTALRAKFSEVKITWLVDSKHADAVFGNPLVDDVIVVDTGMLRTQLRRADVIGWSWSIGKTIRAVLHRRFDIVINCHPDKLWTLLFTWAPVRVSLFPGKTHPVAYLLSTKSITEKTTHGLHSTKTYLAAVEAVGAKEAGLQLTVGKSLDAERDIHQRLSGTKNRVIGMVPFSTLDNKDWPVENYVELAKRLIDSYDVTVVICCGKNDTERATAAFANITNESIKLVSGTSVAQYISLIGRCSLIVSGDSSPIHISAALKIPYIALFGPTPDTLLAPLVGFGTVIRKPLVCAPCSSSQCTNEVYRKCMTSITADDVMIAIDQLVGSSISSNNTSSAISV